KEAVYALQDHLGLVLDLDRGRSLDPQYQNAGLWHVGAERARPLNFLRLAVRCDVSADDLAPAGDELGRGEALLGEGLVERLAQQVGKRLGSGSARLVHVLALCHIGRHDGSKPAAQKEDRSGKS